MAERGEEAWGLDAPGVLHSHQEPFREGSACCAPRSREGDQPEPVPNDRPAVWPLVMRDMEARDQVGRRRYGTPLQPFNGRDALRDAYEELLDGAVYLRQVLFERDGR